MEDKIIKLDQEIEEAKIVEEPTGEVQELMSQEELVAKSNEFAKEIADFINAKVADYGKPFPLAVILNSLMFIYVSTVINSVPVETRRVIVEDHFARVIKDLENGEKTQEDAHPSGKE